MLGVGDQPETRPWVWTCSVERRPETGASWELLSLPKGERVLSFESLCPCGRDRQMLPEPVFELRIPQLPPLGLASSPLHWVRQPETVSLWGHNQSRFINFTDKFFCYHVH